MSRVVVWGVLLFVVASMEAATPPGKDVRDVTQLVKDTHSAIVRRDHAFLERTWADEYLHVHSTGAVRTRAQWLADHRAGRTRLEYSRPDDIQVRIYGDTAVALYRVRAKGRVAGRERPEGDYRVMRVFVRRNGRWQCVAAQFTRVQH
jgi:ketosteroid isomerase-like protein